MSERQFGPRAQLAMDVISGRPTQGIPNWNVNVMEWRMIDRLASLPEGSYQRDPIGTYCRMVKGMGSCLVDQWIPENPLTMGAQGYEGKDKTATTGAAEIVCDGIAIDSPEAVVEHLERVEFPTLEAQAAAFDEEQQVRDILTQHNHVQELLGPNVLKTGYGFVRFPAMAYSRYGYEAYFTAFALYPEVMERHFALQADLHLLHNRAAARAFREGKIPSLHRLDHDMADSRGTLVNIDWLDRLWFPHFARCLEPLLKTDVKMIWHCDGNLMQMVPRLIDVGLRGFQGFQYEDGMDYENICRMKTRDGEELFIVAGVSVTRTLPFGTPEDIRREMAWLVEHGPRTQLTLGASSSITPGVPWENLQALVEGFEHYLSLPNTSWAL